MITAFLVTEGVFRLGKGTFSDIRFSSLQGVRPGILNRMIKGLEYPSPFIIRD
jgi:hypothetical protein